MSLMRTLSSPALRATVLAFAAAGARAETYVVSTGSALQLQAAFDAANVGDVIVVRGTYYTADLGGPDGFTLDHCDDITLRAKGRAVIDGQGLPGSFGIAVDDVQGLTIEGFTFTGLDDDGIFMQASSDFTIRRCKFIDIGDAGIEDTDTQGYVAEKCRFIRCNYGLALGYFGGGNTGVSVTRCKFVEIGLVGVDVWASGAFIEKCSVRKSPDAYGIRTQSGFINSTISRCRFSQPYVGILANGAGHELVSNKVSKSVSDGVRLGDGGGHSLIDCKVSGSVGAGVYINSTSNTITGSSLKQSGSADIYSTVAMGLNTFANNKFKTAIFP